MRIALAFAVAAVPLAAGTAAAQGGAGQPGPTPDVTVRGPERMVCRMERRTGTRMRAARVCRPVSQMQGNTPESSEEQIAEAADRLDALGADDISTNCIGNPLDRSNDTPLGPR